MREKKLPNSAFGFERPEDSLGFLLWQTTITWQRLIKKVLDPQGVTHPQFVLLALLLWCQEKGIAPIQSTLISLSKLDKMTVSTALKALAKQGYVTRQESIEDSRAKQASLTPKGKELVSRLVPLVEGVDKHFFEKLGPENQKTLGKILHLLTKDDAP